jgi:hypothetical protein
VHLDYEWGVLHHDGLGFDPDKTDPCRKVVLGKRPLKPVDVNLPADIIDPVQAHGDHGFMLPSEAVMPLESDSCCMLDTSLRRKYLYYNKGICQNEQADFLMSFFNVFEKDCGTLYPGIQVRPALSVA